MVGSLVLQKQQNKLESPHMRSHQTTTLALFFLPITTNFDLSKCAKMNQYRTHLGHRSSTSTVTVWTYRHTHTRTRPIALAGVVILQKAVSVSPPQPSQYDNSQQHISLIAIVFCTGFAFTVQFTEKQGNH